MKPATCTRPCRPRSSGRRWRSLAREVFEAPTWLTDDAVLGRIEATGGLDRITGAQANVVNSLLSTARLQRLADAAVRDGFAYSPTSFFDDLRAGVWGRGAPDVYRRAAPARLRGAPDHAPQPAGRARHGLPDPRRPEPRRAAGRRAPLRHPAARARRTRRRSSDERPRRRPRHKRPARARPLRRPRHSAPPAPSTRTRDCFITSSCIA